MISKEYTEVQIRLVIKDGDLSKLEEPIQQLARICEYQWNVSYLDVTENEVEQWKEVDEEDYEEEDEA